MPRSFLRLAAVAAVLLVWSGCDSFSRSGPATFTGTVLDDDTGDPVEGVLVRAISSGTTATTTTTDTDGAYALTVEADSTDQPYTLTYTRDGYDPVTETVLSDVDDVVAVPIVSLRPEEGIIPGAPGGASGPAASLTLDGRTAETVGVTGAGAAETATLVFQVFDGQGRPIDADNAVDVSFEIVNGPGGGESIDPTVATTGTDGRAAVTLTSGDRAGTVQVLATAATEAGTIRSLPITITITGGLPDQDHFSVGPAQFNFAGYNVLGLENEVTAIVGDIYGNPVQPGTAVYFTTDGGVIEGSGVTDALGRAPVTLVSANPRPSNAYAGCGTATRPEGYGVIRARTSDLGNAPIETTTSILFSGVTQISILQDGLSIMPYDYVVADQFGHPLAPGTSISVTADGTNIKSTGDVAVTLGDHLCPGDGRTEFRIGIAQDEDGPDADPPVLTSITITVTSPNGNASLTRSGLGRRAGSEDVFERFD